MNRPRSAARAVGVFVVLPAQTRMGSDRGGDFEHRTSARTGVLGDLEPRDRAQQRNACAFASKSVTTAALASFSSARRLDASAAARRCPRPVRPPAPESTRDPAALREARRRRRRTFLAPCGYHISPRHSAARAARARAGRRNSRPQALHLDLIHVVVDDRPLGGHEFKTQMCGSAIRYCILGPLDDFVDRPAR
jgi:hypothetical protein